MSDKIEEIRARYAGYSLNSGNAGKANEDRGWLLAEVDRLRADRRERIATAALQGLLSDPNRQGTFSDAGRVSVEYAGALIAGRDRGVRKP